MVERWHPYFLTFFYLWSNRMLKENIPNGYIENGIVSEQVWFIPDIPVGCYPPYIQGKKDSCWVRYRKGQRPTTKEGWEEIIGMSIQIIYGDYTYMYVYEQ